MKLKLATVAAIAAMFLVPSAASAQSAERCAVGYRVQPGYGYADVVRMYGSVNYQPNVQLDAAVCSNLIAAGWFGVSKWGEWERRNGGLYRPICRVDWPWGNSLNVYARVGGEWAGYADCGNFSGDPDATMSDLTSLY